MPTYYNMHRKPLGSHMDIFQNIFKRTNIWISRWKFSRLRRNSKTCSVLQTERTNMQSWNRVNYKDIVDTFSQVFTFILQIPDVCQLLVQMTRKQQEKIITSFQNKFLTYILREISKWPYHNFSLTFLMRLIKFFLLFNLKFVAYILNKQDFIVCVFKSWHMLPVVTRLLNHLILGSFQQFCCGNFMRHKYLEFFRR